MLLLGHVPFIDATGIQALQDLLDTCKYHKTRLVLSEARPNVTRKLAGLVQQLVEDNVLKHLHELH